MDVITSLAQRHFFVQHFFFNVKYLIARTFSKFSLVYFFNINFIVADANLVLENQQIIFWSHANCRKTLGIHFVTSHTFGWFVSLFCQKY